MGKPEGKKSLARPAHSWKYNIKLYLQERGCVGMDWIYLAQDMDRWMVLASTVKKHRGPLNVGNFLTG
jgi:hypothetical protein